MVRVRVNYGGDGSDPVRWYRGKIQNIEKGSADAVKQAVEDGEVVMKEMISTRGTGKDWGTTWFGGTRTASIPDRIDSGNMVNSVSHRFNVTAKGNVVGAFGWITNREDYFAYQEGGFQHHITQEYIEGMYAMVDAAELVFGEFQENMRKVVRDA